jgi:hypothetical protein
MRRPDRYDRGGGERMATSLSSSNPPPWFVSGGPRAHEEGGVISPHLIHTLLSTLRRSPIFIHLFIHGLSPSTSWRRHSEGGKGESVVLLAALTPHSSL